MSARKHDAGHVPFEDPPAAALRTLRGHLELDEIEAARGVYDQSRQRFSGWRPPPSEWLDLIGGLIRTQAWDDAIRILQSYLDESEAPTSRARLKLAQLLIQKQSRPARALRILAAIPPEALSPSLVPVRAQLIRDAEQMLADGPLELGDEV